MESLRCVAEKVGIHPGIADFTKAELSRKAAEHGFNRIPLVGMPEIDVESCVYVIHGVRPVTTYHGCHPLWALLSLERKRPQCGSREERQASRNKKARPSA